MWRLISQLVTRMIEHINPQLEVRRHFSLWSQSRHIRSWSLIPATTSTTNSTTTSKGKLNTTRLYLGPWRVLLQSLHLTCFIPVVLCLSIKVQLANESRPPLVAFTLKPIHEQVRLPREELGPEGGMLLCLSTGSRLRTLLFIFFTTLFPLSQHMFLYWHENEPQRVMMVLVWKEFMT